MGQDFVDIQFLDTLVKMAISVNSCMFPTSSVTYRYRLLMSNGSNGYKVSNNYI